MLVERQSRGCVIGNEVPVTVLLMVDPGEVCLTLWSSSCLWLHAAHLPQGWNPLLLAAWGVRSVERTSMSLRLVVLRKAAMGGSGIASLHRWEECEMGKYLLSIVAALEWEGLKVRTSGTLGVELLAVRGRSASDLEMLIIFLNWFSITLVGYRRDLRWVLSCSSLPLKVASEEHMRLSRKAKLYGRLSLV